MQASSETKEADVESGEPTEDEEKKDTRTKRLKKFIQYYLLLWTIQILCALLVLTAVLWASIQFMRIWNVLGISQEPPGLTYLLETPAPPPPPPVLVIIGLLASG